MRHLLVASVLILMCVSIQAEEKGSAQTNMSEMGILTGKVKFSPTRPGPIRPNEPEDPEILRRIYANYKVRVLAEDGKKLIRELEINPQGMYKTELEPGVYFLRVYPSAMGKIQKEAQRVEVTAGKTIQLDISVDTGMR